MDRPPAPDIPLQADEPTMLNAFLDYYRAALLDRAFGLTQEQLQLKLSPSTLTLSRLIGHMALVEQTWFRNRFDGLDETEPWASLDWEADRDAEMTLAQTWPVEKLLEEFNTTVAESRRTVEAAESLDQISKLPNRDGEYWNMRWIMVHMIEEYARHCGHADLIRESIDGNVAE